MPCLSTGVCGPGLGLGACVGVGGEGGVGAIVGVGAGGVGGDGGDGGGEGDPPQDGREALASKVPVQTSQLLADRWHQPVPSSPQSPQSAPNLQQPPPVTGGVGAGGVGGEGGVGTGEGDGFEFPPSTLKSTQEMKVSVGPPQVPRPRPIALASPILNLVVLLPTLLASLQVFPVFQIQ